MLNVTSKCPTENSVGLMSECLDSTHCGGAAPIPNEYSVGSISTSEVEAYADQEPGPFLPRKE